MKGMKLDAQKPRWDLLPLDVVEDVVMVLTFGAQKYSDNNWQHVTPADRYLAAAFRHIKAWRCGETHDDESGIHHLAHAICSLMFLFWHDKKS
jgi:hypothetical protein